MKKYTISALLAAGLLAGVSGSASAADLGGNCCADLEERIAELEATTARKGNRKVSLTISGWVTEQVMWWDDGVESNTYVVGSGTTLASNVKFSGSAQIAPGWSAGYLIHVELDGSDSLLTIDQTHPTGNSVLGHGFDFAQTVQSYWFMKSDTLGKVSVGLVSQASDNTAILVDGSGSLVPANWVPFEYGGFKLRDAGGALTLSSINSTFFHGDRNGIPLNAVRYDSPTFGGFSVSASWGQDDFWDVAARYAGEWGGFKVAVAAAYFESTDASGLPNNSADGTQQWQIGAYIQHVPSGIFVYGAYGDYNNQLTVEEGQTWYIKAGLRQRWSSLGHTVLYGEWMDNNSTTSLTTFAGTADTNGDGIIDTSTGATAHVDNPNMQLWGGGIVQEIDAAAMSLWLTYRHIQSSSANACLTANDLGDCTTAGAASLDFDQVKFGALINF